MKILALDIGMNGAYARNYGLGERSGLSDCTRKEKQRAGVSLIKLNTFLYSQPFPDLIVHELLFVQHGDGARLIMGFGAVVEIFCTTHDIELVLVPAMTLKKWATGKGNCGKPEMKKRAGVDNHNLADAMLLLEYMLELKGLKTNTATA